MKCKRYISSCLNTLRSFKQTGVFLKLLLDILKHFTSRLSPEVSVPIFVMKQRASQPSSKSNCNGARDCFSSQQSRELNLLAAHFQIKIQGKQKIPGNIKQMATETLDFNQNTHQKHCLYVGILQSNVTCHFRNLTLQTLFKYNSQSWNAASTVSKNLTSSILFYLACPSGVRLNEQYRLQVHDLLERKIPFQKAHFRLLSHTDSGKGYEKGKLP